MHAKWRSLESWVKEYGSNRFSLCAKTNLRCAQVGFSKERPDALTRRSACAALSQLARAGGRVPEERLRAAHSALTGALVASGLPEEGWYSVAEAAVCALYALHPQPSQLCEAVLRSVAKSALAANGGGGFFACMFLTALIVQL